jgi:hypothetical protein
MNPGRNAFAIACGAVLGLLGCALFANYANPEIQFWQQALAKKRAWAARPAPGTPRVLICGGSSAAFALDPLRFEQVSGLPCGNFALFAGLGTPVMIEFALREARPGDTIVLALEPGLLTVPMEVNAVGQQMLLAGGSSCGFTENPLAISRQSVWSRLNLLRPGGYHFFTIVARRALGRPSYPYRSDDVSEAGWMTTANRRQNVVNPGILGRLSPDARQQLAELSTWAKARRVRIVAALPVGLVAPESRAEYHRHSAAFVLDLMDYFPVVRDPNLGMSANPAEFADTPAHLVPAAAQSYTESLAHAIQREDFWERPTLQAIVQGAAEP